MGWAQTVARPGGLVTGLFLPDANYGKYFKLLKEVRPKETRFGTLLNAANPAATNIRKALQIVAVRLSIDIQHVEISDQSQLPDAFSELVSRAVQGVVIHPDPVLISNHAIIVALARQHGLPSVADDREFAVKGGLFSLSADYPALLKRSAWYVDRILKGENPGDLPAEEAREFKLTVNLKAAQELGLIIPSTIFARADEVIG